jgi:hypothetical protein
MGAAGQRAAAERKPRANLAQDGRLFIHQRVETGTEQGEGRGKAAYAAAYDQDFHRRSLGR